MSEPERNDKGEPLCQSGSAQHHPPSVGHPHGTTVFSPCPNRARYRSYEGIYLCGRHLRHAGRVAALDA